MTPRLVVVTGPPAAGKSAIASALRDGLGLPLIAKDTLKEIAGGALGITERAASRQLGIAVYELMGAVVHELLVNEVSAIVEGNFTARTAFLHSLPPAHITQVHVTAPVAVLRERLLARDAHRHPVHYDREAADEIAARAAAGEWDALPLDGRLVRVDTTTWPDVAPIVEAVRQPEG